MRPWFLQEVCTTSMSSNTDHLEWHLDVYWRCVLNQCAATLITLHETLMSIEVVYYVNVQQHWSPWMISWCLLRVRTTTMCSNTDHLEWYLDVYWRCVLHQCAATLNTLNDILMSTGGMCTTSMCSNTDDVEWHIDVYWRVRTTTMCSNIDHLEWHLDV
jgi:hypothetical protein